MNFDPDPDMNHDFVIFTVVPGKGIYTDEDIYGYELEGKTVCPDCYFKKYCSARGSQIMTFDNCICTLSEKIVCKECGKVIFEIPF